MKKGCAILFLFLALCTYSQNSTLLKNINYRAKELKHSLNKTGDTLILEGENIINRVQIFNSDFEKVFPINSKRTKVPLVDIPQGRFVTEVQINNKLIIMTLLRHQTLNQLPQKSIIQEPGTKIASEKLTLLNSSEGKADKSKKEIKFYWIVKNINKGHSSSKVMRIGDKKVVDKMIIQNKIDLKSKAGKRNELTIWEVYDTSEFMRFKRLNPDYASVEKADCFNTVPFYQSGS